MRILYVENHPRFAKITVQQFLSAHEIIIVPGLAAARQALAQGSFQAVLLDYDLDDGKGVELVRELHAQAQRPVIVAVSSHQVGNNALLAAGADAMCSKMQFSNVEAVLTTVLQSRK